VQNSYPEAMSDGFKQQAASWANRAEGLSLGAIHNRLFHYWHGPLASRKYVERWDILLKAKFDPVHDMVFLSERIPSAAGTLSGQLLAWKNPTSTLHDDVKAYFAQRDEDSTDCDVVPAKRMAKLPRATPEALALVRRTKDHFGPQAISFALLPVAETVKSKEKGREKAKASQLDDVDFADLTDLTEIWMPDLGETLTSSTSFAPDDGDGPGSSPSFLDPNAPEGGPGRLEPVDGAVVRLEPQDGGPIESPDHHSQNSGQGPLTSESEFKQSVFYS